MTEELEPIEPEESEWIGLRVITKARMEAIWSYAKKQGYRDLKTFWDAMHEIDWDFYDVLKAESPD